MNIRRINNDVADREFTAKQLIGKDVYDSRDKKIGEVKDVVLDTSKARQLATALTNKAATRPSVGSSASSSAATGRARSDVSTQPSQPATVSGMTAEPAAIVAFGGFMGVGNNLLQVPLSQLHYDTASDHITLNVTETELSSLKDVSDSTRSATE